MQHGIATAIAGYVFGSPGKSQGLSAARSEFASAFFIAKDMHRTRKRIVTVKTSQPISRRTTAPISKKIASYTFQKNPRAQQKMKLALPPSPRTPNPVLPFLVFLEFLVFFCLARISLFFLSVFPFFSRDFRGSAGIKILVFLVVFLAVFQKNKERKDRENSPLKRGIL